MRHQRGRAVTDHGVRRHGMQPNRQAQLQSPNLCLLQGGRRQGRSVLPGTAPSAAAWQRLCPHCTEGTPRCRKWVQGGGWAVLSHSASTVQPQTPPTPGQGSPGTPGPRHRPTVSPGPPTCPTHHEHEDRQQLGQAFPRQLVPDPEQSLRLLQERSGAHGAGRERAEVTAGTGKQCVCGFVPV